MIHNQLTPEKKVINITNIPWSPITEEIMMKELRMIVYLNLGRELCINSTKETQEFLLTSDLEIRLIHHKKRSSFKLEMLFFRLHWRNFGKSRENES